MPCVTQPYCAPGFPQNARTASTTDGQSHGSRGAKGKIKRTIFRETLDENERQARSVPALDPKIAAS